MTNFIYVANIQVFRQDDGILQIVIPQLPKKVEEVVSKRWHNLFFTFYSPAIFSFAYDAFF